MFVHRMCVWLQRDSVRSVWCFRTLPLPSGCGGGAVWPLSSRISLLSKLPRLEWIILTQSKTFSKNIVSFFTDTFFSANTKIFPLRVSASANASVSFFLVQVLFSLPSFGTIVLTPYKHKLISIIWQKTAFYGYITSYNSITRNVWVAVNNISTLHIVS